VLGACWPLTKFWRSLVMFDLVLGLRQVVEDGVQDEAEIVDLGPF
jgi:hypothetical protein